MKKTKKKLWCIALSFIMIFSSMTTISFAAQGECSFCETEYENGICANDDCGAYEPAVKTTDKYDVDNDSTKDIVYEISNAGQLYWFAEQVNSGNNAINGILTKGITINTGDLKNYDGESENSWKAWTPIGSSHSFEGVFDGNGHYISGLYVNDKKSTGIGLFSYVEGNLNNVYLQNSYFSGKALAGGICACLNSSMITGKGIINDCYSNATVIVTGDNAGGICGYSEGVVSNCYNTGSITGAEDYTGGIAGANSNKGTITGCMNRGKVTGYNYVGGICGYDEGENTYDCYNGADITGWLYVGGISGLSNTDISMCYNEATVTGYKKTGGICGENSKSVTSCFNVGSVNGYEAYIGGVCGITMDSGTIDNCHNYGTITGDYEDVSCLIGGISGMALYDNVTDCYYLAGCATDGNGVIQNGIGNQTIGETTADNEMLVAKNKTAFESGEVCYLLNGNKAGAETALWKQMIGFEKYPSFYGEVVYYKESEMKYFNIDPSLLAISHQPTAEEPYVELYEDFGAKYQWYAIEKDLTELTEENAEIVSNNFGYSSYDAEKGWTGVTDDLFGPHYFSFCTITLEAGDTVVVELSDAKANFVGLFNFETSENIKTLLSDNVTTYNLTVETSGDYRLYVIHESNTVTAKAFAGEINHKKIDDATGPLYAPTEDGLYACEVTYINNTTEMSDYFEGPHIHTPLDAADENYVAPNCTDAGSKEVVVYCSGCDGEVSRVTETIDSLGHTPADVVEENYVAPTCTEAGSVDKVVYCSVCDEEISRVTEEFEIFDHEDEDNDGYCDDCDEQLCDHVCHKKGIRGFLWKIICLFNKVFGNKKYCECGAVHY